jgi:SAM-dependent methyltransferase
MIIPGSDGPDALPVSSHETEFVQERRLHWDGVIGRSQGWPWLGRGYHERLRSVYRHLIPAGATVLEFGCGQGDLLAAVEPARGIGVDFSPRMIALARQAHPHLEFTECEMSRFACNETFDFIVLSDIIGDLYDIERELRRLHRFTTAGTRLILNCYSRLWQIPLTLCRRLGLAKPVLPQSWLAPDDVRNLLHLAGFETLRTWGECLLPLKIPLVQDIANRYCAKIPPFRWFDLTNVFVARPSSQPAWREPPLVSVVVPARNEAGNIAEILRRVPEMGAGTDLIFVEGSSSDDTFAVIESEMAKGSRQRVRLFRQPGKGKADAVRHGFDQAHGDILMILDADMTVPPEDLLRFYRAMIEDRGEYINGVRLIYPMEKEAMQFFNVIANKAFSMAFTWLLGQPIKDTLCGTKILSRENYRKIAANRAYFGEFDPFGDFDLIFGAAKLNLRMVDLPIRYHERTYGETNIQRWRHGVILLRMLIHGARHLKFR